MHHALWEQMHPGVTWYVISLGATRLVVLPNHIAPVCLWSHNAWFHGT